MVKFEKNNKVYKKLDMCLKRKKMPFKSISVFLSVF